MKDVKRSSTLHDDYGKKAKPSRRGRPVSSSSKSKPRRCEHHDQGICEPSREAVRLGLRKTAVSCNGNILAPPDCPIRKKLEDGMTMMEIYQK